MNLSDIKLPRELEAEGTAETIRRILMARTVQFWPGGTLSVPVIAMNDTLKKLLQITNLNSKIQCGLEAITGKLAKESRGIEHLREAKGLPEGIRVSRLLLVSSDGAERFYRHIEHLIQQHSPRLLCCMTDMDGSALGSAVTGKEKQIKVIMAERKKTVSAILRTLLESL